MTTENSHQAVAPGDERKRRRRGFAMIAGVSVLALGGGLALTGAIFTDTATVSDQDVNTAIIAVSAASCGSGSLAVDDLLPGRPRMPA